MAEAAQDVSEVIIECMAFLMKEARGGGGGGRTLSKEKNKFRCRVARGEKCLVKLRKRIW